MKSVKKINYKNVAIGLGVALFSTYVVVLIAAANDPNKKFNPTTNNTGYNSFTSDENSSSSQVDTVVFIDDLITALDYYHYASLADSKAQSEDLNVMLLDLMVLINDRNSKIQTANQYLDKYVDSNNEIIRLVVKGCQTGAQTLLNSNNELYQFLKVQDTNNPDVAGLRDAIAKYQSDQKQGFMLIAISAPQVGNLIYEPAKSEKPTGKIPYKITSKDRNTLIDKIDRVFGDYLESAESDLNAIILAVSTIKGYLTPETYEEANLLKPQD